jgi:cob(I)alamin adenosyltransferase
MKIYTKTGDKGETGLIGGKRISKDNPRIIAYGSVDELSSHIGLVISLLHLKDKRLFSDIIDVLTHIQSDLFIVGSDLADPKYPPENKEEQPNIPRVKENMISYIEFAIDKFEMQLNPITFFIMPGGSIESSSLHISRSTARRAEIAVTTLSKNEIINLAVLVYLNRLSDLLFVCARLVNKRLGVEDIAWKAPSQNS